MAQKIPRRIIQTDKSRNLPLLAQAAARNLRLLNPDFEYLFFDDAQVDEFVRVEFPEYRAVFDSFPLRIQRYDFFRYLAIYRLGGFYFDTDVLLASGIEDLLGAGCVFPFEHLSFHSFLSEEYGMDWEIGNYGFGAVSGHPFLDAIIRNCVRAQRDPSWVRAMMKSIPRILRDEYYVLDTTGPGLVSRTLAEYPGARDQVEVLFPKDVCDRDSWYSFGSYGVHLQMGRWRPRKGVALKFLCNRWESRRRQAVLKESVKRGQKRTLEFTASSQLLRADQSVSTGAPTSAAVR